MVERYSAARSAHWVVEDHGIYLVNAGAAQARLLAYPEAAVWDLFSRGDSFERVVRKVSAIAALDGEATRRFVRSCIDHWVEAGYLVKEGSGG